MDQMTRSHGGKKTFDAESVACLLFALLESSNVVLGKKHYKLMSAASEASGNSRGEASFDHQFRSVKERARSLQKQIGKGAATASIDSEKSGGSKGTIFRIMRTLTLFD